MGRRCGEASDNFEPSDRAWSATVPASFISPAARCRRGCDSDHYGPGCFAMNARTARDRAMMMAAVSAPAAAAAAAVKEDGAEDFG